MAELSLLEAVGVRNSEEGKKYIDIQYDKVLGVYIRILDKAVREVLKNRVEMKPEDFVQNSLTLDLAA